MSLRVRLASAFALVALITAGGIALATPTIVGRGFALLTSGDVAAPSGPLGPGGGMGPGGGQGPGPMAGLHAQQVQQETTQTIILVALVAAAGASLVGVLLAGRISAPLGRLEEAARGVAAGDLSRRSGLGSRTDEIGELGRSFDAMAAEIEQAEGSRRRFFQDAAHELKTPLAVIDATTTAVMDGVYPHDDEHLATIREQARLLSRIVDDLRTIGLAEAGELPLRIGPTLLDDVAAAACRAFDARARLSDVRLEQRVPTGLAALADRDRLGQALAAVLDNALRHTPAGGTVTVGAERRQGRVRLAVADTGGGLAPEDIPRLFDRFYQADPARDRSTGSSGLGLAIVRALVEAQGGRVGAANGPAGGATFWIDLPGVPATPADPGAAVNRGGAA
jgi:two-component system sensor histidine kinase BaeS